MFGVPAWIIGVVLSFGGCVISNLGVNLQKLSHTMRTKRGSSIPILCHPIWLAGLICIVGGSVADLVSFGFAPISLLAPLGAMTLVVNMVIAPVFFREKIGCSDVINTFIILGGTVLALSFGSKEDQNYTLNKLVDLFYEPVYIVYMCCFLTFVASMFISISIIDAKPELKRTVSDRRFQAFCYPALAGAFGSQSVLFTKSSAEVVKQTINGHNAFSEFIPWVLVGCLIFCLVMQMRMLNAGLHRADALYVVPVYQVFWVCGNVVAGMVYFQDYKTMSNISKIMFSIGIFITMLGVYFLSRRGSNSGLIAEVTAGSHRLSDGSESYCNMDSLKDTELGENDEDEVDVITNEKEKTMDAYGGKHATNPVNGTVAISKKPLYPSI